MMLRAVALSVTVALAASTAEAQQHALSAGSAQIAGSASFTSVGHDSNVDEDRLTTIGVNPSGHYFVADRLAIGADIILGYATMGDDASTRTVGLGPSLTYYFGPVAAGVHPYVSARAALASTRYEAGSTEIKSTTKSGAAVAGVLAMLSRAVGVTTELFYQLERSEAESSDFDTDTFGLAVGIAAFVF